MLVWERFKIAEEKLIEQRVCGVAKINYWKIFLLPYSHILGASWYWCWYGYPIPSLPWITVNPSATPLWPFKIRIKSTEILKSKFDQPVSELHYFKSNFSDIWRLLHCMNKTPVSYRCIFIPQKSARSQQLSHMVCLRSLVKRWLFSQTVHLDTDL